VLHVLLEGSGLPEYDYVGLDTAFASWTEPKGQAIAESDRRDVRHRIDAWAATNNLRLRFGPPIDVIDHLSRVAASHNFQMEHLVADDMSQTVTLTRKRESIWSRLRRWLFRRQRPLK
jgi:hypothetical protein